MLALSKNLKKPLKPPRIDFGFEFTQERLGPSQVTSPPPKTELNL